MPLSYLAVQLSPLLRTGLAWPSSPAMVVERMLYLVCGFGATYTPAIIIFLNDGDIWGCYLYFGVTFTAANRMIRELVHFY